MLKIRLSRTGKKHQPQYRIVVMEHTLTTSGKYLENLGNYNPFTKQIVLDQEKAISWLNKGVHPTNSVAKLMKKLEMKHNLIVVKTVKAKSKKQLEEEKKIHEEEKTKEQAEKEAAKIAFEEKVEAEKAEKEAEEKAEEKSTDNEENKEEKTENIDKGSVTSDNSNE